MQTQGAKETTTNTESPLESLLAKPLDFVRVGSSGTFEVETLDGLQRLAKMYMAAGLCDGLIRGSQSDKEALARVTIALSYGRQLGFTDVQSLSCIAVINGRPCLYGDGPLALVLRSGKLESKEEFFEGEGKSRVAVCRLKRRGVDGVHERRFGEADRAKAGINNPTYAKYPDRMFQMRARGFALRDLFADCLMGVAIAEEMEDQQVAENAQAARSLGASIAERAKAGTDAGTPEVAPEDAPAPKVLSDDDKKFVEELGL